MMRPLIALIAAVAAVGLLGAGPLSAAAPPDDLSTDEMVGQQVARLLLIDSVEAGDAPWERERLEDFVDRLETDRTQALDIEVVDDVSGPALAVTVDALGDEIDEVCVIADDDGQPTSTGRPCATS